MASKAFTSSLMAAAVLSMTGCTFSSYMVNDERFSSREQAVAATQRMQDAAVAAVAIRPNSIDANVLVISPTKETCAVKGLPSQIANGMDGVDFHGKSMEIAYANYGKALASSKAFTKVDTLIDADPEATAKGMVDRYSAVYFVRIVAPGQIGWMMTRKGMANPVSVPIDPLTPPGAPRLTAWIETVVGGSPRNN